jgi:hypothetical protein
VSLMYGFMNGINFLIRDSERLSMTSLKLIKNEWWFS